MSKTFSNILYNTIHVATTPLSPRQRGKTFARISERLSESGDATVQTNHGDLKFFAGRGAAISSAVTRFHQDEPETLYYIDTVIQENETLWDIGANVGLYSLYAAKRGATVFAFEPSAYNFALLVDHIRVNALSTLIKPFCIAFAEEDGLMDLQMAELSAGHASNSVGTASNQHGDFTPVFQQSVITMRVDSFIKQYGGAPDHIKLDVDGIEPLILNGAEETLKTIKSLLIEIEGKNEENDAQMIEKIEKSGLKEDISFRERSASGRNRLFTRA